MLTVVVPWFGPVEGPRKQGFDRVFDHLLDGGMAPLPVGLGLRSVAAARNRGAQLTTGPVLVFNDADTLVEHEQIRVAAHLAEEEPGLVYGYTVYVRLDEAGRETGEVYERSPSFGSAAISRFCFEELGGFDEEYEGAGYEDLDFLARAAARWPVRRVEGLARHLWHGVRYPDGTAADVDRGAAMRNQVRWLESSTA